MRDLGLPAGRDQEHERRDRTDVPGRAALGDRGGAAMGLGPHARHAAVPGGRHVRRGTRRRRAVRGRIHLRVLRTDADERVAHGDLPVHGAVLHRARPAPVRPGRATAAHAMGRCRSRLRRHRARVRGRLPEAARARRVRAGRARRRRARDPRRRDVGRDDGRRALDGARAGQREQDAVLPARGIGGRAGRARRAVRPDVVRARDAGRAGEPRVPVGDRRVRQLPVVVLAADALQRVPAVRLHVPVAAVRRRVRRVAARRIGRLALHVRGRARADRHRARQRAAAPAGVTTDARCAGNKKGRRSGSLFDTAGGARDPRHPALRTAASACATPTYSATLTSSARRARSKPSASKSIVSR
ncbi:hypothetical protein F01_140073 [Burkholderia cenocepacia]|nr:hypothetical protein F01_140073 [Burkholderia cenocepacia]